MNIIKQIDYQTIILFVISIFKFIFNKFLLFIIYVCYNEYLFFINPIIYSINQIDLDLFSDSDFESDSESELKIVNKNYDFILKLFHIDNNLLNSIYPLNDNDNNLNSKIILQSNSYYIIDCFLFNLFNNKNEIDIDLKNIYNLHKKIILINNMYSQLNSQTIHKLFPTYNYFYIFYKNNKNQNLFKLIDLSNNINIQTNKKNLFNIIKL